MGVAYGEYFQKFAESKNVETGKIVALKVNPDQSKHLETAKFRLLGLELDLVNLRSEEYAEDSRIPTGVVCLLRLWRWVIALWHSMRMSQTFGTPLQDALRRDITINSLFYNMHTREVEDQTGQVS